MSARFRFTDPESLQLLQFLKDSAYRELQSPPEELAEYLVARKLQADIEGLDMCVACGNRATEEERAEAICCHW